MRKIIALFFVFWAFSAYAVPSEFERLLPILTGPIKPNKKSAFLICHSRNNNSNIPAMLTPMDRAYAGAYGELIKGVTHSKKKIIVRLSRVGVKAAAQKRPNEFKTPANKDTSDTKSKNGKVIRLKVVVRANFPAICSKPGAKININPGITNSIKIVKINRT